MPSEDREDLLHPRRGAEALRTTIPTLLENRQIPSDSYTLTFTLFASFANSQDKDKPKYSLMDKIKTILFICII